MKKSKNIDGIKTYINILHEAICVSKSLFFKKLIVIIISTLITYISLALPKATLNALQNNNKEMFLGRLFFLITMELVLVIIQNKLSPSINVENEYFKSHFLEKFLKKSLRLRLDYFDLTGANDKYIFIFNNIVTIFQGVMDVFLQGILSISQIIVVLSYLSWIHPVILILLLGVSILRSIIAYNNRKEDYQLKKNIATENKRLNYLYRLFYLPEFMRDLRVNIFEGYIFSAKQQSVEGVAEKTGKATTIISNKKTIDFTIASIEAIIVTSYLGIRTFSGLIGIDTFIVSQNAYFKLKEVISNIVSLLSKEYENRLYLQDYTTFMAEPEASCSESDLLLEKIDVIEFRRVSFGYAHAEDATLKNVSFTIKSGERVIILGENGAGKTTIIKLLLRLYEPSSGRILINGIDIEEYNLVSLRSHISALFQDYTLYAFSIKDNLTLGQKIDDSKINDVLVQVSLFQHISKLPMGIYTPITNQFLENGIEFSGGERQRIAIARQLLRNSEVEVYDEPTSNLDPEAAKNIIDLLFKNRNKTIIIITHNLQFTELADRIFLMCEGELVEQGSHKNLMDQGKKYYSFYTDVVEAENK